MSALDLETRVSRLEAIAFPMVREEKAGPADTVSHMWSEVDKARLAERDGRIAALETGEGAYAPRFR